MAKQIITTDKVARPRVPLSPAVKVGNLLFVSGSTPFDVNYEIARGVFSDMLEVII